MRIMMLALGIGCAGCSFATVHGSTTPSPGEPACTQSYTAPAVDTGWVVGNLAGMAIFNAITSRGGGSDQQKTVSTAYFATAGALSGLFLISAIYGYAAVARCNRFEEAALFEPLYVEATNPARDAGQVGCSGLHPREDPSRLVQRQILLRDLVCTGEDDATVVCHVLLVLEPRDPPERRASGSFDHRGPEVQG